MSLLPPDYPPVRQGIQLGIPAFTVFLAMLVMALPIPLAWGVMPHLALLLILIWASIQPRLMPAWLAFLLGLLFDIMVGLPIGHSALLFSAVVATVRLAEAWVEGHNMVLDWLFAAILILAAQLLSVQILRVIGHQAAFGPMMMQAALTILAFPLMVALAARVQRRLAEVQG